MKTNHLHPRLEAVYARWHDPAFIDPDPLAIVRQYSRRADREIAALIAAGLAYGRVARILTSVARILAPMGPSPAAFFRTISADRLKRLYPGFVHRFADETAVTALLEIIRDLVRTRGSLYAAFQAVHEPIEPTIWPSLTRFVHGMDPAHRCRAGHLIPDPDKQSACKRLHLFLRWMVRRDRVDPGGWDAISPAQLVVPLDVHMHRMGLALGLTRRRSADRVTALEITRGFVRICPDDPVRYDFALTRLGIRNDADPAEALDLS